MPKCHPNIKTFGTKLKGKYIVIDSIINKTFGVKNSIYHSDNRIILDTLFATNGKLEVYVTEKTIISKYWTTCYIEKSKQDILESLDTKDTSLRVTYIGDTLKIEGEDTDTILDLQKNDIVRKYKKDYVLNKFKSTGYQISIFHFINDSLIEVKDLDKNEFMNYFLDQAKFRTSSRYQTLIDKEKAINISNSLLRRLIKYNAFRTRLTIKKLINQ